MMRKLFLTALLGLGALSSTAAAQSIAGEWDASMGTPGGVRTFRIEFKVKGDTLTGTVKREAGNVPLFGTIKGNVVKFSYTITYNENPFELSMTATVDGDTMKGTVNMGGQAEDEFTAKRVKPAGS
jgi:hypothetical protein